MNSVAVAAKTLWNSSAFRALGKLLDSDRPDVCHFHNTFPLMSPAVFHAAKSRRIPVVLTLHNYRLVCPSAVLMREERTCHDCVGKALPVPSVIHGCYRGSRIASAGVGAMLSVHHLIGTWRRKVDLYIALTQFSRNKFIEGGLPADRIAVKPNFVHPDPGFCETRDRYALFVGRLSIEKGVKTMLEAWRLLGLRAPVLRIAGDGPLAAEVRNTAATVRGVEWLGQLSREEVLGQMRGAAMLIFPSIWYEGLPLTILEAFACGSPVIASDLGSMPELVADGQTGLLFAPGSADDLAEKVLWASAHTPEMRLMSFAARQEFERNYSRQKNHDLLMECYRRAASGLVAPAATESLSWAASE
jgi:glycosyltransferase involved in cell wall biosynthesis